MKNKALPLIITLSLLYSALYAQTQQGSVLAGGNINLTFIGEDDVVGGTVTSESSITDIRVNPLFGYFVANGMVAGAGLNIISRSVKDKNSDFEFNTSGFTVGPFFRYYRDNGPFGHAAIQFGSEKVETVSGGSAFETTLSIFGWELGPGYAIFLNENVSIEGLVVYQSRVEKVKDSNPEEKENFGGIQFRFGFSIFIN